MADPEFPGLPIGRLVLDEQFRIVDVDAMFQTLYGGADLVGASLDDLVSDRDRRGAVALASRLSRYRGEIIDLPLVISVSGRDHYVRMRLVASGARFVAYIEPGDVDDSLTYELALARQRWGALLQRSDEGIVLLSPDGTILQHNARFFELMKFRTAHGISLAETALQGRALVPLLPRPFDDVAERLARNEDDFVVHVRAEGRDLEVEGRTLRLPLRGRIETLLLVRDLSEQRQIAERDALIQADLEQAAQFQDALLGRRLAPQGLDIDVAYRPLHRVGGDLYDVALLPDRTVRLFIADATGHGVKAAMSTMLIKSEYDAVKDVGGSPANTLAHLNERITRTHQRLSMMFTAMIVDIAPDRRAFIHSCGAHPSPVVWSDGKLTELQEGGPFLGALPNQRYPEWRNEIDGWSSMMLVTDGVTDARNAAGQPFGEARLHASFEEAQLRNKRITASVLSRLDAFVDTERPSDDITLLAVRKTDEAA